MTINNEKYNALRVRMSKLELEFLDTFCDMTNQIVQKL